MVVYSAVSIQIAGKGEYENCLDENGKELEWLDGVGLTDGHYCKHYRKARDWTDKSSVGEDGKPCLQHYCAKAKTFAGFAYCCSTGVACFEKGKSAGVQHIRNKLRKKRMFGD